MSGKVSLIGIGPGQAELITPQAAAAIGRAQVIIGHPETLAMIESLTHGKEVLTVNQNPLERSRLAVERAAAGHEVAVISTGDPGVYAIAATFYGYLRDNNIHADVEVIPGLNLAAYAAARLGAPLGNDSATISLSDRCASWPDIHRRLEAAAAADFIIVIYNPLGKLGPSRLQEAARLIVGHRPQDTPAGILSRAATPEERIEITTLEKLPAITLPADTLIIIGNSHTRVQDGRMVTPRPYSPELGY